MFGRLLDWYTIYTFSGALAPDGILSRANFTLRPILRYPILAALLRGIPAAGVSHTLRLGIRMELRNFGRGCHLYSAGRPSRWALAHISSSIFFPRLTQRSQSGCQPYFYTWCVLSANLECRSEMCCTQLAENTGRQKLHKNRHLGTIVQLWRAESSQLRHVSTIGKNC